MAIANPISTLPRATFRQHIAERLRAAILSGELEPGSALVETTLAERFSVSRAPLREALRQLVEEGLITTVPYTGTRVIDLTVDDVREIHSLRTTLERFAFEQVWPRRDAAFGKELQRRNAALAKTIDRGDDAASIAAELELHSLVYEASGHRLLQRSWTDLRGRLQLYWAAHHRAHGKRGPRRDAHDSYIAAALGDEPGGDAGRGRRTTCSAVPARPSAFSARDLLAPILSTRHLPLPALGQLHDPPLRRSPDHDRSSDSPSHRPGPCRRRAAPLSPGRSPRPPTARWPRSSSAARCASA